METVPEGFQQELDHFAVPVGDGVQRVGDGGALRGRRVVVPGKPVQENQVLGVVQELSGFQVVHPMPEGDQVWRGQLLDRRTVAHLYVFERLPPLSVGQAGQQVHHCAVQRVLSGAIDAAVVDVHSVIDLAAAVGLS